jgi:hypothetical protein
MLLLLRGLLLVALAASPALAAPDVMVSTTAAASALVLDGEGSASVHIVMVAHLSMSTDGPLGFMLTISSGALSKPGGRAIAYQVTTVAPAAAPPGPSNFAVPSGSDYTFSTTSPGCVAQDLYIMYTPASLQDPGGYAANISIGIVDR